MLLMKKILAQFLLLYCAVSANAQSQSDVVNASVKLNEWGLTIGDSLQPLNGPYVHLRKEDGKWKFEQFTSKGESAPVKNFTSDEVLQFSADFTRVQPDFRVWLQPSSKTNVYLCLTAGLKKEEGNTRSDYNPCDSSLTSVSDSQVTSNVLLSVIALGTRSIRRQVVIDPVKVVSLLEESQLIQKVMDLRTERWLSQYRNQFTAIDSTRDIESFVSQYASKDPENLLPQANAKREMMLAKDAERARAQEIAANERREASEQESRRRQAAREAAEQARQLAEQQKNMATLEFRRTLTIGSKTFCGPVINLRGPMVQIAINAPLAGFTAEPWLDKNEIYPATLAGCRNNNGRLQPVW